jgi:hypothetical protein
MSTTEPMLSYRNRMMRVEDLCLVDTNSVKDSPSALFEVYDINWGVATGKCYMSNIWFEGERTEWGAPDDDDTAGILVNAGGGGNNGDESTFRDMRFHEIPFPFKIVNGSNQSVDWWCEHWWVANARTIFDIGAGGHLTANMITFNDASNPGSNPMVLCDLRGDGASIGSNTDNFVFRGCKADGGANFPNGMILVRNTNPYGNKNNIGVVSFYDLMLTNTDSTGQNTPYIIIDPGQHVINFFGCRNVPRKTHAVDNGFAKLVGLEAVRPAQLNILGGYGTGSFPVENILTDDSQRANMRLLGVKAYGGSVGSDGSPYMPSEFGW